MTVSIDSKALQLTIILLRQTQPILSRLLPGLGQFPRERDVELDLNARQVGMIVNSLTELGNEWLNDTTQPSEESERNSLRQKTIGYLLHEWIKAGESFEYRKSRTVH